jgi:hypothetical protein
VCRGLNCSNTTLVEAHIIPRAFARDIRGNGPNMQLRPDRVGQAKPQLGEYDPDILCSTCDGTLGSLDDYAIDVCRSFREHGIRRHGDLVFEIPNVDCNKLARFVLAVLWRASISSRLHFAAIRLGPYEDKARDALFEASPLSEFTAFQVLAERIESERVNVEGLYTHPVRHRKNPDYNLYSFTVGGFRFFAKVDARPFPKVLAPYVLSGCGPFRGRIAKLEETEVHSAALEMLAADHMRKDQGA